MAMETETHSTGPDTDVASWERNQEGLLIIPPEYRTTILHQCHDSQVAGHWGRHQTQEIISRDFIWNGWMEDVARYVARCPRCQRAKADRHSKKTKLVSMPTGERLWEEIAMDFIGELLESNGYNNILMITNHFRKMQHYIPAKTS